MNYSKRITRAVERYRQIFDDKSSGQILVSVSPYTFPASSQWMNHKEIPLNQWNPLKDARKMAESAVKGMQEYLQLTEPIEDDFIPALGANYGIGLFSAVWTDTDIKAGEDTSWIDHVLTDYDRLDEFQLNIENNRWCRFIREYTETLKEYQDGSFAIGAFSNFAPSDMANALRGNDLFYDVYDEPENVELLLERSADVIIKIAEFTNELGGGVLGGTATGTMWIPGNGLFMSEDAADMCSNEIYETFFKKHTQRILDHFGHGYIHHHALGWHNHHSISALNHLDVCELSWDPNRPRPIDHIEEVIAETAPDKVLQIRCTCQDVYEHIQSLKKGRVHIMLNTDSVQEAKETVRFIRSHSRI